MKTPKTREPRRIDLGKATVETKGVAVFGIDPSAGKLNYVTGIVGG